MTRHRYGLSDRVLFAGIVSTVVGIEAPRSAADARDPVYMLCVPDPDRLGSSGLLRVRARQSEIRPAQEDAA